MTCSPKGITATFDLKHIWKRYASRIRTQRKGIKISRRAIRAPELRRLLNFVEKPRTVMDVLDASDKQNVPNTIRLFRLIVKFGELDLDQMVEDKKVTPVDKVGFVSRQRDLRVLGSC